MTLDRILGHEKCNPRARTTLEEGKRGEVRGSLIRDHMLLCQVSNVSLMPPCYTVCQFCSKKVVKKRYVNYSEDIFASD